MYRVLGTLIILVVYILVHFKILTERSFGYSDFGLIAYISCGVHGFIGIAFLIGGVIFNDIAVLFSMPFLLICGAIGYSLYSDEGLYYKRWMEYLRGRVEDDE